MRLVDADALTDEIMERYCKECDNRKGIKNGKYRIIYEVGDAPCRACPMDDMKDELDNAPTIEPVQKGHWDKVDETPYIRKHFNAVCCSACRKKGYTAWNYCPNCGAKMKEGDQDA